MERLELRRSAEASFYTRREGSQNQPVLLVREGLHGADRVLLDPNQLSSDGTVALDWWFHSHDGRYVAYGTSASGSEISTLRVIETATGKLLADTIERTRAASVAWTPDSSGFYYTRYPKPGEVPAGQEVYHRQVFYHALGTASEDDPLIFAPTNPEDWPSVDLSDDGRWLLITVSQGWVKSELYLIDLERKTPPVRISPEKEFIYGGHVFRSELYVFTNEGAPRYRVMKASVEHPEREHWLEIIAQSDAVLQNIAIVGGTLVAQYEHIAISQLKLFQTIGAHVSDIAMPGIGSVTGLAADGTSRICSLGFSRSLCRRCLSHRGCVGGQRCRASLDPTAGGVRRYTSFALGKGEGSGNRSIRLRSAASLVLLKRRHRGADVHFSQKRESP